MAKTINDDVQIKIQGLESNISAHERQMNFLMGLMTAVVIVLFIGFVTILMQAYAMVMDSNDRKTAAQEQSVSEISNLTNTVSQQNSQIETITTGLKKYKIIP